MVRAPYLLLGRRGSHSGRNQIGCWDKLNVFDVHQIVDIASSLHRNIFCCEETRDILNSCGAIRRESRPDQEPSENILPDIRSTISNLIPAQPTSILKVGQMHANASAAAASFKAG